MYYSVQDLPRGVQCWMDLLCSGENILALTEKITSQFPVPSYPPRYLVNAWLTVAENMREKPFDWRVGAELLRKVSLWHSEWMVAVNAACNFHKLHLRAHLIGGLTRHAPLRFCACGSYT